MPAKSLPCVAVSTLTHKSRLFVSLGPNVFKLFSSKTDGIHASILSKYEACRLRRRSIQGVNKSIVPKK